MLFSALVDDFNGALEGVFRDRAGLLSIAHYLIVEDGEIKGKTQADRVERQDTAILSIAELQ